MSQERLDLPGRGKNSSDEAVLLLLRDIKANNTLPNHLYTRATLKGSLATGKTSSRHLYMIYDFLGYGLESHLNVNYSKSHLSRLSNFILEIDSTDQTIFEAELGNEAEIAEFIRNTTFPEVILECGITVPPTPQPVKRYMVLYHTKDLSTDVALDKVKTFLSPYGIVGK